jgi:FkbM family methyltransferase
MVVDDLIFDVGMHKGEDTSYYLKKGFRVVAFEADPDLIAHCKARFADAIQRGRLHIVEGGIAPRGAADPLIFYKHRKNSLKGTIRKDWAMRTRRSRRQSIGIEIPRVDVAKAFEVHGVPYYLKIDIEGADTLVLDALSALPDRPRYLSLESERVNFPRLEQELDLLVKLGYRRFCPAQQANIHGQTIITTTREGERLEFTFEEGASGGFGSDISGWMSREECLEVYRAILKRYRWLGKRSLLAKVPGGRLVRKILRRTLLKGPGPGWYDTHAAL